MTIKIIHQKDPANIQKPVAYKVEEGTNVLAWLCDNFTDQSELSGDLSCSFVLNDKEIFRSDHEEVDQSILDFTISNFDRLVIVNRPGLTGTTAAIIAIISVVVSVAAAAYAYYNMPNLPGDAENDSANTSPNNLLNAASNTMRTGEGIPECFGKGISFPDRAQPYYYYYEDNIKKTFALLTVGVGSYNLPEVRVGDTDINDITSSSYEIIEPYASVDQSILQIHRASPNVDGQVALAPDDSSISGFSSSSAGEGVIESYGVDLTIEILTERVETLNLAVGLYLSISSDSLIGVFRMLSYSISGLFTRVDIRVEGDDSWFDPVPGTGFVAITNGHFGLSDYDLTYYGEQSADYLTDNSIGWFELTGSNDSEVLVHWQAPNGLTSDERKAITVNMRMQARHEESGAVYTIDESMRLNTLDPQYRTTKFNVDTVPGFLTGQYSVRMKRLTNTLPSGYVDTIKAEAFVGVEYYTKENFANTTNIFVQRTATLTGQDQSGSKINCDYERKLPYYNRATDEYETDNLAVADAFADAAAYTLIMKGNETESTVDLAELYGVYDSLADSALGEFTFTFDDANISKGERIESICNVARTTGYHDGKKWRFARDEIKPVRSALFNRRSVVSNNAKQTWQPQRSDDADSVRLYYVDPDDNIESTIERAFDTDTGEMLTGEVGNNVLEIKLAGCRNVYQATNRADLEVRRLAYQRRSVTETTYRDALEIDLLDRVGWVDINDLDTFDGEIMSVTGSNYETTERFEPVDGESYFVFITDDEGYPSNTVECLPRTDAEFGFYAEGLSGAYIADSSNQVGSRYFITNANDLNASNFIIQSRTPNSDGTVSVDLVEYNSAMYDGDSLLPPSDATILSSSINAVNVEQLGVDSESSILLNNDGTITISTPTGTSTSLWYSGGTVTNIGDFFQAYVSVVSGEDITGITDQWVDLDDADPITQRLSGAGAGVSNSVIQLSIREIADNANSVSKQMQLNAVIASLVSMQTSITVEDVTSTNAASASLEIASNGKWKSSTSVGNVNDGNYTTVASGIGALYECMATNLVGDLDLGTVDEWVTLDGSGTLFTMNSSATETVTFDLEIREIANTSNSDTTSVTLKTSIS